ncbi:MAG: cation diffusion facilitator family transporter [Candidatus Binatia bacterium]
MTPSVERVGIYAILVNIFLFGLNVAMAALSGSLALAAEGVHNLADLTAAVAVFAGLKLSQRKSRAFPYGLYKIENVVAIGVAFLIFFTAYEVAGEAVLGGAGPVAVHPVLLVGTAIAALVPWLFGRYALAIGRAVNSPSVIASATELRAHVLSSGVVFAGLAGQLVGWPLDRPAALLIVVWIVRAGWQTLADGMRVLLDASVDAETLHQARQIIEQQPAVIEVKSLIGRNAGRYRFLETEVGLRVHALEKAHQISHTIETAIRNHVPYVEHVLVHMEPARQELRRIAVPLADRTGAVSMHFGTAPYFALVDMRTAVGNHENQMTLSNPYAADPRGRGLKVAQWLLEQRVDMLITADDVREKGPGYALGDAGVAIIISEAASLEAALAAGVGQQGPADQPAGLPPGGQCDRDLRMSPRKDGKS